jgi:hypothetical protein
MNIVQTGLPELAGRDDMCNQLSNDLSSAGFTVSELGGMMTPQGLRARRATAAGEQFLRFITDPRQNDSPT